jgi:RNA polymerase sigma factor (sigma-70 family)
MPVSTPAALHAPFDGSARLNASGERAVQSDRWSNEFQAPRRGGAETDAPETIDREALFEELQPLVRRLIRQYGEDREFRQDLAGEIYCRFCDLLDAFDPGRGVPLRPYMVRNLTASVYTFSRSQWRRQYREVGLDTLEEGVGQAVVSSDPTRQWDQELATQAVLGSLPSAIAKLPQRQRQVVIWRYYEGRSFEEMAALMNIQASTARSLLRHGLNNLRRTWSGLGDDLPFAGQPSSTKEADL